MSLTKKPKYIKEPTSLQCGQAVLAMLSDNTVDDIIKTFNQYGITPIVSDPWASERDAMHEYGVTLTKFEDIHDADCVIIAVAHNEFKALSLDSIKTLYKKSADAEKVFLDVKGLYKISDLEKSGMTYWRL